MKLSGDSGSQAVDADDAATEEIVPDIEEIAKDLEEYFEQRREVLKDIPYETVRSAWFALAHLLLDDGATVVNTGTRDGTFTFCMAALAPKVHFIGIDKSKRNINKAREKYDLHNLDFVQGDITADLTKGAFKAQSVDAVINSFILHEVYSNSRYTEEIIRQTLQNLFKLLKPGGSMFIHDYPRLNPEEFCLLELPDELSRGDDLEKLSEADLLVWYSQNARARVDPTRGGFFIEELPPRRPRTRLFRLPFKWAYEFIVRKGRRERWTNEVPVEYTFFTMREFRKELKSLGARVHYSGPRWDDDFIADHLGGKFRLFDNDGRPMETPPTSFVAVATKMRERKSLLIEERRPSNDDDSRIQISAMRNERTGELVDLVTPSEMVSEILPYRISDTGRLKIYLHDGVARGVTNSVARNGVNIDGKLWSGHLVEAIAVETGALEDSSEFTFKDTVKFSRDYLGLKPQNEAEILQGPDYYPSPDFIDERIFTFYLNVHKNKSPSQPKKMLGSATYFQSKGMVKEFDAQQILNAIAVGMIPSGRLELQILSLFEHLGLRAENWTSKDIVVKTGKVTHNTDHLLLIKQLSQKDHRFREIKGTTGNLRAVKSIFVEEGVVSGARSGLHSHDLDFVVSEDKTINTAVVLPLTSNIKKDIHAGFSVEHMPAPQRFEGNGQVANAPSFNIPPEIKDIQQMKKFIADKFNVTPDMVFKLGESYYTHIGISPQRIYPFGVAAPSPALIAKASSHFVPIKEFRKLWKSISKDTHFMLVIARGYKYLQNHITYDYIAQSKKIRNERLAMKQPDWSVPMNYAPPPGKGAPGQHEFEPAPKKAKPAPKPKVAAAKPEPKIEPEAEQDVQTKQIAEKPKAQKVPVRHKTVLTKDEAKNKSKVETSDTSKQNSKDKDEHAPRPEKW